MSVFTHIVFLALGVFGVITIFQLETKSFNSGRTNRYLKVRKSICSEQDFKTKLRVSVFKSFMIRFVFIGVITFVTYFCCMYILPKGECKLGTIGRLSMLDYLVMWISFSMIAMADRAHTAIWSGYT